MSTRNSAGSGPHGLDGGLRDDLFVFRVEDSASGRQHSEENPGIGPGTDGDVRLGDDAQTDSRFSNAELGRDLLFGYQQ